MKNLYEADTISALTQRIERLTAESQALWGVMDVAQMMAHVVEVIKNGLHEKREPRQLRGYIIAPFWRHKYYNDKPYKLKNVPTHPSYKMVDPKDFETEKAALLQYINRFHKEGREKSKDAVHPVLGRFTPEQWAIGQYKHLDHHLRQFGV